MRVVGLLEKEGKKKNRYDFPPADAMQLTCQHAITIDSVALMQLSVSILLFLSVFQAVLFPVIYK